MSVRFLSVGVQRALLNDHQSVVTFRGPVEDFTAGGTPDDAFVLQAPG